MANYPGSLDNLDRPEGANSLALNHHALMHQVEEEAIEALEAKVGVANSQVAGTHEKRINDLSSAVTALQTAVGSGGGVTPPTQPTVAALTVTPNLGTYPFTVTGNASLSTSGVGIRTYAFNWGDGATTNAQAGATATHSYSTAGVFTVQVTVTDANLATSIATATVTSNAPAAAGIDLSITALSIAPAVPVAGDPVTVTATVKNNGTSAVPAGQAAGQNIPLGFYIDGVIATFSNSSAGLAGGATISMTSANGWAPGGAWTAVAGGHTLRAFVNDNASITETNSSNNTFDLPFTVTTPAAASSVIDRGSTTAITAGTTLASGAFTPAAGNVLVVVVEGTTV